MNRLFPTLFVATLLGSATVGAQVYETDFITPSAGNAVAVNKASQSEFMWPPNSHLQQMDFSANEAIKLLLKPQDLPAQGKNDGTIK